MSTIVERARAEADEAERENPDEEHEAEESAPAEPEPEPEPEPEAEPVTEARLKKITKAIEAEDARHAAALRKAYGDTWGERETCPLCLQEGFIVPAEPGTFDPMHRMVVLSAMGDLAEPVRKEHPKIHRCEQCDGQGFLATGSVRDGYTEKACFKCDGNGYIDEDVEAALRGVTTLQTGYSQAVPPPPAPMPNADSWGRPLGHPHWGQDPAYVGATG